MNPTHLELSFELLHVGWHCNLQIFEFLFMSQNPLYLGALTQHLARRKRSRAYKFAPRVDAAGRLVPWLVQIRAGGALPAATLLRICHACTCYLHHCHPSVASRPGSPRGPRGRSKSPPNPSISTPPIRPGRQTPFRHGAYCPHPPGPRVRNALRPFCPSACRTCHRRRHRRHGIS